MYYPGHSEQSKWNDWTDRTADPIGIPFIGDLNGVPQTLTGTPLSPNANLDPLMIGIDYTANPRIFEGRIDEVRIWSVVRSRSHIQATMNWPLSGNEPGLEAYYRFEEGSGTMTADLTGHNHTATLVNGVAFVSGVPAISALWISSSANQVVVSWPTNFLGLILQTTTNLNTPITWSDLTNEPAIVSGRFTVTNTLFGSSKFFRLRR